MKEPLRVPFESGEPDLAGPRLVHETDGDDGHAVPAFCDELREARLRGGYSLGDAARVLRIQEHYLQSLEEGRFDDIPGTTYTIGFLRSYAGFLALDPDEVVDAFKREQGLQAGEQRLAFPSPSDTSPKPKLWLVLVVLVLAGLAYGGWQYQSTGGQIATDLVADVSTRLTEAVGLGETDGAPEAVASATTDPVEPVAAEPVVAEPVAVEPVQAETAQAASSPADPAPADPAPTAVADEVLVPAAEQWDEAGTAGAVEIAAVEELPANTAPVPPPPSRVEVAARAEPEATAPVATAEIVETILPAEPAPQAEAAAPVTGQRPALAAPLDLASASAGGSSTVAAVETAEDGAGAAVAGSTRPDEPIMAATGGDTVAAPEPPSIQVVQSVDATPEPAVDPPSAQTVTVAAVTDEPSWPSADTGYVPKVYGRSNIDARVVITAVDDSWVQVQGPDNELLLTRILHTGDSFHVPDRPGLVMVTGNAGGLEIRVDDVAAPALGPLGVVMRNIALDPDRLLAGTASNR